MGEQIKGTLLTLIAGIAWGLSGVSGQYLMGRGIGVELLTTIRLCLAGLVLLALVLHQNPQILMKLLKNKKDLLGVLLFSVCGLVLNQFAYLTAIYYTNAGTATVLQYLCPILVLAYVCVKDKQLPTVLEVSSIFLAILGTLLIATHGHLDNLAVTPQGLAWGLFSAMTYSLYIILPIRLIQTYGSLVVISLSMFFGSIMTGFAFQPWKESMSFDVGIVVGLVGIVGIGTVFAYTAFLKGVSMVGQVNGSLLASIEPIASVFFAMLLIKEQFYIVDFMGMLLILLAVGLTSIKDILADRKR